MKKKYKFKIIFEVYKNKICWLYFKHLRKKKMENIENILEMFKFLIMMKTYQKFLLVWQVLKNIY